MQKSNKARFFCSKRVLCYLKGTIYSLIYSRHDNGLSIFAYSDADWTSDVKTTKSVSGMVIKLNESNSPVFWRTAKQRSVSLSTCESEYMALSALAQEVLILKHVFEIVNYKSTLPILLSDNQAAICIALATASRSRAKHIDINVHFVRKQMLSGKMTLNYFPSTIMVADVLTKGLPRIRLAQNCKLLFGIAF